LPFLITALVLSYIYEIWRLKKLGGPSMDEFKYNNTPPWGGQTKFF